MAVLIVKRVTAEPGRLPCSSPRVGAAPLSADCSLIVRLTGALSLNDRLSQS